MPKREFTASAFTLIELLVVIAIIAMLISILVPSLRNAREQAKTVKCASNLRSLMLAVVMYTDDHEGRFPQVGYGDIDDHHDDGDDDHEEGDDHGAELSWLNQLAVHYGNQNEIVVCPSDRSDYWFDERFGHPDHPDHDDDEIIRRASYASNAYTVFQIEGRNKRYDHLGSIRQPATTIFFAELVDDGEHAGADHVDPDHWLEQPDWREAAAMEVALTRHRDRPNYAFVDGHVEPLRFEVTLEKAPDYTDSNRTFLYNKYDPEVAR